MMNLHLAVLFLLSLSCNVLCQSARSSCNILYPKESCFEWYVTLKNGLLNEYNNIYEMQRGFYPIGKFASDRMINVLYNIVLSEEALLDKNENDTCPGVSLDSAIRLYNGTNAGQLQFLTGWTSSGVFNILTPLQLTKLQLQLSNTVFGSYILPGSGIYEPGLLTKQSTTFLNDIIDLHVPLQLVNIMNLTIVVNATVCIPDVQLIRSSLIDITVMLKVWASTQGKIPQQIDESLLGYITEPGIDLPEMTDILAEFESLFAVIFTAMCCLIGISSIAGLSTILPVLERHISPKSRNLFYLYYIAISLSSFIVCVIFIVFDFYKFPTWCSTESYDHVQRARVTGCDGTVIAKIVYYCVAIPLSLIASILTSRSHEILSHGCNTLSQTITKKERGIFITGTWFILLAVSLGAWALVPTVLQLLVYPSVILTLTLVMWAAIFWFSVMFTIPLLLYRNIKKKKPWLKNFYYVSPFLAMVLLVFVFGFITGIYLDAIIFGTQIGDIVGVFIAAVSSIGFTLFTEFHRDWFLTKTDMAGETENDEVVEPPISPPRKASWPTQLDNAIPPSVVRKTTVSSLTDRFNNVGLVSTGEPPGFLKRKLSSTFSFALKS